MNVFPAFLGACIDRLGAVTAPCKENNPKQYQHQVPGRIKNVYFGQKNPHNSSALQQQL